MWQPQQPPPSTKPPPPGLLRRLQCFRVVLADGEQAQGGTAGFAGAVLPRDCRDLWDVQQRRELHLRAAELNPQGADGFRGHRFDGRREIHGAFAGGRVAGGEASHAREHGTD